MFSIIIPTWNNLTYLKKCVESIRKNSVHVHEIILHINDGSDGTLAWAEEAGIKFTHTAYNAGICVGVNWAAGRAERDYIMYMNDDMYVCPGWDEVLLAEVQALPDNCFMLSATMIEPRDTGNACVIHADFGDDINKFREAELLRNHKQIPFSDWNGSAWPPTLVHKKYWHIVGGYSIEFSPGMSSDDDFAMKMWLTGCRVFKGVAAARVYHFQAKSTGRIEKNDGRTQFLNKWGINQSTFNKYYLQRGTPFAGPLQVKAGTALRIEMQRAKWKRRLK